MKYIFTILGFIASFASFGCSCTELSFKYEIEMTDLIVRGKIISHDTVGYISKLGYLHDYRSGELVKPYKFIDYKYDRYKLIVERIYLGELSSDTLTIFTYFEACGSTFDLNKTYTVFGNRESFVAEASMSENITFHGPNIIWTNYCTSTCLSNNNMDAKLNNIFPENRVNIPLKYQAATLEREKCSKKLHDLTYQLYGNPRSLTLRLHISSNKKIIVDDFNFHDKPTNEIEKTKIVNKLQNIFNEISVAPRMTNGVQSNSYLILNFIF